MMPAQTSTDVQHQEHRPAWWNPLHWPAGIWVLVIGGGLMLVPFGIRAVMLSGIPAMAEPFDIEAFTKWDVPTDQDAFTEYRQASEMFDRMIADQRSQGEVVREPEHYFKVLEQGWSEADEPITEWLKLNREALLVWRRGTDKQQGLNLSPSELTIASLLNVVQNQRMFVRLALMEQAQSISEGKIDEARGWARAAFRCGGHTSHRGCAVQGLVGSALHAMSANGLVKWAEQPTVASEDLKRALGDVKSDYELYELPSNTFKTEYIAMHNTFQSGRWVQLIGPVNPSGSQTEGMAKIAKMGYWVASEPELTMRIFRQLLGNQLPEIDKPLSSRRKLVGAGMAMMFDPDPSVPLAPGQLDPAAIDRAIKRSFLARILLPAMKQYDTALRRQAGRQATLEVALAAQIYRRDKGEFPPDVQALVPAYLAVIPLDPCDPKGGLVLYRRDERTKAVVWSVGDDGNDGGGNVVAPENQRPLDVGYELK